MASESVVGITVRATDEASRTLLAVRGELVALQNAAGAGQSIAALTHQVADATTGMAAWDAQIAAMRARLVGLTTDARPAAAALSGMTGALSGLPGVATLAAAGLGTLVATFGIELVQAVNQSRESFRAFQRDLDSADASRITGQMRTLRSELELTQQRIEEIQKISAGPTGGFPSIFERAEEIILGIRAAAERRRLEQAAALSAAPGGALARGRAQSDAARAEQLLPPGVDEAGLAREEALARQVRDLRQQLVDQARTTIDPIERARLAGLRGAARTLAEPGGGAERAEIADLQRSLAGQAAREAIERRNRAFRAADYATAAAGFDESLAFVQFTPGRLEELETIAQRRRLETPEYIRQREEDLRRAAQAGDEGLAFTPITGQPGGAGDLARGEQTRRTATQLLTLEQQRTDVERQRIDLLARVQTYSDAEHDSQEQRLAALRETVDLKRIDAEITAQTAIADATGTAQDKERLEILRQQRDFTVERYAIEGAARERARQVRDDPQTGALQGLQDFEDMANRQGERFRVALFSSLSTVSQGITDILVSGLSGDIDRIGDIGKQMGQALMRSLLQELVVTPLVSTLSQTIRGALGGLGGAIGGGGAGGAVAAGGGLLALLGLGAPTTATASTALGVAPNLPVGSIVQTAAGAATVTGSGALALASSTELGSTQLTFASGAAAPFAAPAGSALDASGGFSLPAAASGTTGSFSSAALGGAAGIAAVGFTAYSGYQNATTTQDVAFAGVTGGVAGAAAGAAIGGYFGQSGYGALIGAVAGAAISAGAAAYGKGRNQLSKAEREKAEAAAVAQSLQPMFGELDDALLSEDLYAVIKKYTHQAAGGERSGRSEADTGIIVSVLMPDGPRSVIQGGVTPDQLVEAAARGVSVQIIAGVSGTFKGPLETRLADAITKAAARIRALGPRFFFTEQLGGGISRTTVLGLGRLAEASGQDISVVVSTLAGLDPGARQRILDKIAASDINGAVDLYAVETNLTAVRVGQHAGTPPPGAITPVQAQGVADLLTEAQVLGPGGVEELLRQGVLNASPGGGETGPDGGPAGPGITGISVNGGNINVTLSDNTTVTISPSAPGGLAGQLAAQGLQALGVPAAVANVIGTVVDLGIGFAGPMGSLIGLANRAAGMIAARVQGRSTSVLGLPTVTVTPARSGMGLDPDDGSDPNEGIPDGPPGTVTVGEPTISNDPDTGVNISDTGITAGDTGGGPGGSGASDGGVGAGGTGGSGDPGAYAEGGWVPGDRRKGDVVPATVGGRSLRLAGEEFVVNAASAAENPELLEDINQRTPGRFPRQAPDRPMSDAEILRIGHRLFALNLKHDLGWFPGATNHPLTAARTF